MQVFCSYTFFQFKSRPKTELSKDIACAIQSRQCILGVLLQCVYFAFALISLLAHISNSLLVLLNWRPGGCESSVLPVRKAEAEEMHLVVHQRVLSPVLGSYFLIMVGDDEGGIF